MGSAKRLVIFCAFFLLASCSSVGPQSPLGAIRPLTKGQAKLTAIQMPEYVHENLPYDVILDFSSEGPLDVRRVCFKWLSGRPSFSTSATDCLMGNGEAGSTGDSCRPDTSSGSRRPGSALFCADPSSIRVKSPGKLVVRIRPQDLHSDYNMLQAQVEYVCNGKLEETNIVATPVKIDR